MRIVTIAREIGAFGTEQEEKFCKALGLRSVHRDALEDRFKELGADFEQLKKFDEKKPGVFDSLFGAPNVYSAALRTAILQEALQGDVAIVGRGANFLLGGVVECLRLRFIAPLELRAKRVASQYNIKPEQALNLVKKCDREREGFCKYFYDREWQDSCAYDLIINTAEIHVDDMLGTLNILSTKMAVSDCGARRLNDLSLTHRIRHKLLSLEHTDITFLDIDCNDGNVVISGSVSFGGSKDTAEDIVRKMDGVKSVTNQIQVAPQDVSWHMP